MKVLFRRYHHHSSHRWCDEWIVQDIRSLNGKFRAFMVGPRLSCDCIQHEDRKTWREAAEAALEMRRCWIERRNKVIWC